MGLKITLVGAGSVVFAKNLLGDILRKPELAHATICLMDIAPDRLKVAEVMTQRMIETLGVKAKVVATLDRRAAVRDANYVICTIQVGGYKPGTVADFEIPRKYGLLQTIGDTLGVGGVFRGLRTMPVLIDLARDIADVGAPGCLLLNYANPMAMNCTAVARAVGIPHVGLCHSVQGTAAQLAQYADLPFDDVTYLVAGINHMAFFLKYEYRGQDAYPLLFKLLDRPDFQSDRVRFEMMRRTGYFVTESSEHQSEYVPYFIHHGKKVVDAFEVPIDEYLRRCESIIATWEKAEADLLGQNGTFALNPPSHEYGSQIILSRETNQPCVIYGNVPNTSLIDNLPADICVEVPCLVDAQGIQPTHIGLLPPQLAALCQTNINVQTLAVEAVLTGRREHIYHAVMLDPHTSTVLTLDKIWAMCDELIAAHQKFGLLGEFAPTLPGTGRAYAGTGDRVLAEVEPAANRNGKFEAEVVVTNPRAKPYDASLEVSCVEPESVGKGATPVRLKLRIPAGKTARKKVTLPRPTTESYTLRLATADTHVLVRDSLVRARRQLRLAGQQEATFELELAGCPAVKASLARTDRGLQLRAVVDDTKILTSPSPWEGSDLELFFVDPQHKNIHQFFVVPQPGLRQVKVLDRQLKPVRFIKARLRPNSKGSGYEVTLEIPFSSPGLKLEGAFFFDLIARLGALGDAHAGGATSLSGSFDSAQNSSRFALVEVR